MIQVTSEIGKLKKVLVHRPDRGISRISPKRAEELLFDDIVYVPEMMMEHDIFTDILKVFVGEDSVFETEDLIFQALEASEEGKVRLIEKIVDYEELPSRDLRALNEMDNKLLTQVLVTGYHDEEERIYFDPIPNFIFTRDIAVTVHDHVIITKAAKIARQRENFLTRFIFAEHPDFKHINESGKIININDVELFPPSKRGEQVSVEGGDIMMIDQDFLLIGASERTTPYTIACIKEQVFKKGLVNNVVQINIPNDRAYMHIDTLFTRISETEVVCFKPIIFDGNSSNVDVHRKDGSIVTYDSVKNFFLNEINENMRFIFSGDGVSPYQEREQWTDGCNLVALQPGVAVTYDRNPFTEKAFKEAGYDVIKAVDFLNKVESGVTHPDQLDKTIITIPSNELSRARGGSHCMTCPIHRV